MGGTKLTATMPDKVWAKLDERSDDVVKWGVGECHNLAIRKGVSISDQDLEPLVIRAIGSMRKAGKFVVVIPKETAEKKVAEPKPTE
jgi:hypothetical protein